MRSSVKPLMAVNGVRSSCETSDTTSVFSRSSSRSRVRSRKLFAQPDQFCERVNSTASDASARFVESFQQVWLEERTLELFSTPVLSDGRFLGRFLGRLY